MHITCLLTLALPVQSESRNYVTTWNIQVRVTLVSWGTLYFKDDLPMYSEIPSDKGN